MIRRLLVSMTVAAFAAPLLLASPLSAQAPRLPVINNGVPRGVFLAGDIGLPNDAAGGGETYAATGGLGIGSLGFTATIGSTSPDLGSSEAIYGGTANLRLIGGPLIPFFVNLQGGAGYANFNGSKTTHVPVGLGIGLTIPLPVFGVKPWFAPRWDYTSVSRTGFNRNSTSVFGYSAGLDLAFVFGLGIRAAYDWANIGTDKPKIWSIGAKWSFGV